MRPGIDWRQIKQLLDENKTYEIPLHFSFSVADWDFGENGEPHILLRYTLTRLRDYGWDAHEEVRPLERIRAFHLTHRDPAAHAKLLHGQYSATEKQHSYLGKIQRFPSGSNRSARDFLDAQMLAIKASSAAAANTGLSANFAAQAFHDFAQSQMRRIYDQSGIPESFFETINTLSSPPVPTPAPAPKPAPKPLPVHIPCGVRKTHRATP